jgi:hypothetical protein
MRWLLDLAVAFLALGMIEALVKPLTRRFVQSRILAAAPLLFRQLDLLLPALLQRCSGADLEQPGRVVFHAQVAAELQRGDPGFGLAVHVKGQKPGGQ